MGKIKNIPKIETRKLMTSGSSVVLTVPKEWLDETGLKAGQEVLMIMNGHLEFREINEKNIMEIRNQLTHNPAGSSAITQDSPEGLEG